MNATASRQREGSESSSGQSSPRSAADTACPSWRNSRQRAIRALREGVLAMVRAPHGRKRTVSAVPLPKQAEVPTQRGQHFSIFSANCLRRCCSFVPERCVQLQHCRFPATPDCADVYLEQLSDLCLRPSVIKDQT